MLCHKLIAFAVLSLMLLQLHQVNSEATCGKNFTKVADKCLLASNQWYTWYEADRYCHSLGAALLSLQNQAELLQIEKWLSVSVPFKLSEFWTSGNTLGKKGVYFWQSTGEVARFLPWYPDEPKPASGDCLSLYPKEYNTTFGYSDYRLMIKSCTYPSPLVCEKQPQKYDNTSSMLCLKPESYENAQVLL
ncbi:C-type lectin 37Da-like [Drosophila innubila]|uniref:C-type lectin 37Da-like n=1 Tax=Drosophila innubila TaxID=198719 RepID=UPI00148CE064|nr:C-type lectin 37Da-like [Drosophila innubila]